MQQIGRRVCWVTQLIVHQDYCKYGLASGLLQFLHLDADDNMYGYYGIMSSHPAVCMVAMSALGKGIEKVCLEFIRENAEEIIRASPILYVREAKLHESIFKLGDLLGLSLSLVCFINQYSFTS